jgi:hypothetical protein
VIHRVKREPVLIGTNQHELLFAAARSDQSHHCGSNLRPRVIAVAAVLFDSVHATQKLYADFHRILQRTRSQS